MTFDRDWSDLQVAANGWVDETAGTISWQQLMSNVFNPEIRLVLGDESSATAYIDNFALKAIPEPGTLGLLGAVLAALGVSSRRKRR
jgi:hypothetical protein